MNHEDLELLPRARSALNRMVNLLLSVETESVIYCGQHLGTLVSLAVMEIR